jgi:hypothetical protein
MIDSTPKIETEHVDVPAQQVQPRERDVLRPEHEGQEEVAEARRDRGTMNMNTMIAPCRVNRRL